MAKVTKTAKAPAVANKQEQPKEPLMKPHELMLMPAAQNACAMHPFGIFGEVDVSVLVSTLGDRVKDVTDGNMKPVEAMLYGQAQALQAIFTNMAQRSALNMGKHMGVAETYMRLALKAQAQCRTTLETLAVVKNPQPYIRQANIANGPQQVNNGSTQAGTHARTHFGESHAPTQAPESGQSKLLEASHGNHLEPGAQGQTGSDDPHLEAVGKVHRA